MKTRVTITLDPAVHARAKAVARARSTTVSGLIEAFLRSPDAAGTGGSLVDKMLGCAELRTVEPGRNPLYDALHARHIARRR
ncbi:MAG: hypothetical protein USCGTAYLOR_01244 [Chromatiales bacterium USCg_Taylor]|nr:MAG: hypothetical protein USCGTAYLOR_01244 [Chromatiales bacterium USCg_Taylor]